MRAYPVTVTPERDPWSTGESNLLDRLTLLAEQNGPLVHLAGLQANLTKLLDDPAFGPGIYRLRTYTNMVEVVRRNYPNDLVVATIRLDLQQPVELRRLPPPYPTVFPGRK